MLLDQNLDLKWDEEILILNSFDFYLDHWHKKKKKKNKTLKENDLMFLAQNKNWFFSLVVTGNSKFSYYVASSKYMDKPSSL